MTGIEFKTMGDEVGLYCVAKGKVEREGEPFRVTLKPNVSQEWQRIETKCRHGLEDWDGEYA